MTNANTQFPLCIQALSHIEQALSRLELASEAIEEQDLFLASDIERLEHLETVNHQAEERLDAIIRRLNRALGE